MWNSEAVLENSVTTECPKFRYDAVHELPELELEVVVPETYTVELRQVTVPSVTMQYIDKEIGLDTVVDTLFTSEKYTSYDYRFRQKLSHRSDSEEETEKVYCTTTSPEEYVENHDFDGILELTGEVCPNELYELSELSDSYSHSYDFHSYWSAENGAFADLTIDKDWKYVWLESVAAENVTLSDLSETVAEYEYSLHSPVFPEPAPNAISLWTGDTVIRVLAGEEVVLPQATDPDGDELVHVFPDQFDENGVWQTEKWNYGGYDFTVIAFDGVFAVEETYKVQVVKDTDKDTSPMFLRKFPQKNNVDVISVVQGETAVLPHDIAFDPDFADYENLGYVELNRKCIGYCNTHIVIVDTVCCLLHFISMGIWIMITLLP